MSDIAKERAVRLLKKRASFSSLGSHDVKAKETRSRTKDFYDLCDFVYRGDSSISTVSYMEEPGPHDENLKPPVLMGNTYQLGPATRFPAHAVTNILKDVLTNYLQEEKYEAELCRGMTKTISEVVKARVKELKIPRYKIIVLISIGQLDDQSMHISSRCLWDPTNDTFSTHTFKNSSLFAVANVYAVYFE